MNKLNESINKLLSQEYPLKLSTLKTKCSEEVKDLSNTELFSMIESFGYTITEISLNEADENKEYLIENIPPDLAKAYRYSDPRKSHVHPEFGHNELAGSSRRNVKIDYGKATYRVISADEAIQLYNENPENVKYLRILFTTNSGSKELAEFEKKGSGVWATHRGINSITLTVNGETKTYKNPGFVQSKDAFRAFLQNADKIYWTDEYDHIIQDSPELMNRRNNNSKQFDLNYKREGEYDPHNPGTWFAADYNTNTYDEVPDTGVHYSTSYYEKRAFNSYTAARKALKSLESNKDDLDPDYYEKKKAKLTKIWKDAKIEYDRIVRAKKQQSDHDVKRVWSEVVASNTFLASYLKEIQELMTQSYKLKNELEQVKAENSQVYDPRALEQMSQELIKRNSAIKDLQAQGRELDAEFENDAKASTLQKAEEYINAASAYDDDWVNDLNNRINSLKTKADNARKDFLKLSKATEKSRYDKYKHDAEKNLKLPYNDVEFKNARREKDAKEDPKLEYPDNVNKNIVLDPSLNDVVEFVDF